MKRELIKRKRIRTIGPMRELKKYRISFLKIANIKTKLLFKGNTSALIRNSLLTKNVYNLTLFHNVLTKESN